MSLTGWMKGLDAGFLSNHSTQIQLVNRELYLPILFCLLGILSLRYLQDPKQNSRSAPHVRHWIPWLGSAIAMGRDPDGFMRRASEKLGPMFKVTAAGMTMTYVTSPELISAIYRDSKRFVFLPVRLEFQNRIFGMSRHSTYSQYMIEEYLPMHHLELSPKNSTMLHHRYIQKANIHILEAINKFNGKITDLQPFLHLAAYNSAAYAFFGDSLDVETTYNAFRKFDDAAHLMLAGVPRIFLPGPYQARDDGIKAYEEYLKKQHDDCSPIIRRSGEIADSAGWSFRDKAAVLFIEMWAIQTNYLNSSYWVIALLLQHPDTLASVISEVDAARKGWQLAHPDAGPDHQNDWMLDGTSFPLLTSVIQEALRYSSSVFSIRIVDEPVELGGCYLEKGERVLCITRAVHMDEEIHHNPEKFIPDRYLGKKLKYKNGKPVANHTMPFGGGVSMCEGRHFASGELRIFVAFLLTYATIEIDPDSPKRPKPMTAKMGGGIMPPEGDLHVKIGKRDTDDI